MPQEISAELRRVTERWARLPLPAAEARTVVVRRLLDQLAAECGHDLPVPDLGPNVLADQLTVLVYDACTEGRFDRLESRLSELRRAL